MSSPGQLPSSSDLRYFAEVAQTANLSRAAERLGISQPSLTLSIQRLEANLGAPLLLRSQKGVLLTPAGERLFSQVRRLLEDWEKVRSSAVRTHDAVEGRYILGCHPSVALYSLKHFLPDLLGEFPALELNLQHDLSRRVTEAVVSLRVDIGIVVNPAPHPDLVLRKLCTDEVTFWTLPKATRDSQRPGSGGAVLACDPDLLQTQALLKGVKAGVGDYARFLHSSNLEVLRDLVLSGVAVGVLPTRVALREGAKDLVRVKGAPVFRDEIYLAYHVASRGFPAIKEMSRRIESVFKS